MNNKIPFFSESKFYDDVNFPYGFAKSGMFNCEQAGLLELHGRAYSTLALGKRLPESTEESDFIAFCEGRKEAESAHERTWKRYLTAIESNRYLSHGYISRGYIQSIALIDSGESESPADTDLSL